MCADLSPHQGITWKAEESVEYKLYVFYSLSRPPDHVSGCEMAHLLVRSPRHILSVFNLVLDILLWSIDSCQKRVFAIQCHLTVSLK